MAASRPFGVIGVNRSALEGRDRIIDVTRLIECVGVNRDLHIVTIGTPRNMEDDRNMVLDAGPKQSGGSLSTILVGTALAGRLQLMPALSLTNRPISVPANRRVGTPGPIASA